MKRLFFAIALLMTTLSANAQYDPGKWSMQIKYGLGASMFTGMFAAELLVKRAVMALRLRQ